MSSGEIRLQTKNKTCEKPTEIQEESIDRDLCKNVKNNKEKQRIWCAEEDNDKQVAAVVSGNSISQKLYDREHI